MPVELEEIMMRRCGINYKTARSLVMESRQNLGMSKFAPWTDDLKSETERLYTSRFGEIPKTNSGSNSDDSITAPGSMQSYSNDGSEQQGEILAAPSGEGQMYKLILKNNRLQKKGSKEDHTEEPTETEGGVEDDEGGEESTAAATEPEQDMSPIKKKKGIFSRFRRSPRATN